MPNTGSWTDFVSTEQLTLDLQAFAANEMFFDETSTTVTNDDVVPMSDDVNIAGRIDADLVRQSINWLKAREESREVAR